MATAFRTVDATHWEVNRVEVAGRHPNLWLIEPDTDVDWLFKAVVTHADSRQGEDWAEKIVSEIAFAMRIPAAPIEMAERGAVEGILSRSVRPSGLEWQDQPGWVLLAERQAEFDRWARDGAGHSLSSIRAALDSFGPPPDTDLPMSSAWDVFVGYLVLDALVANQDRHSGNWSVLEGPRGARYLMPTYDHASSLGFGLTDKERERRLIERGGLDAFAEKGRAIRYEKGQKLPLVTLAEASLASASVDARAFWRNQLEAVGPPEYESIIQNTPRISQSAAEFCLKLLETNRRRLRDVC